MKKENGQVIVVDDNPDYTLLISKALSICKPSPPAKLFHSGSDLLGWLDMGNRPNLILLDINMPVLNGFDILKILKANKEFETIPVIMLAALHDGEDRLNSYDIGANAYISKIGTVSELADRLEVFSPYWSSISQNSDDTSWFRLDDSKSN